MEKYKQFVHLFALRLERSDIFLIRLVWFVFFFCLLWFGSLCPAVYRSSFRNLENLKASTSLTNQLTLYQQDYFQGLLTMIPNFTVIGASIRNYV